MSISFIVSMPACIQGRTYFGQTTPTGGVAPYNLLDLYESDGTTPASPPAGLSFNTTNGLWTGNLISQGSLPHTYVIKATDSTTATGTVELSISATDVSSFYYPPTAIVGVPYNSTGTISGGVGPYTFTLNGTLPTGLTFDNSTGLISGTATTPASLLAFGVTVVDSVGTITIFGGGIAVAINQSNLYPTSIGLRNIETKCLPEGLRLYTTTIDFSLYPITQYANLPSTSAPYVNYPEMALTDNGDFNAFGYIQVLYLTPGNQNAPSNNSQAVGLSVVKALQFYYRPGWGYSGNYGEGASDFALTYAASGVLLITNVTTGQTIIIPQFPYTGSANGLALSNGAMPFFASPSDQIRVLKLSQVGSVGVGKVTLQFANFDIAPFINAANATF